MNHDSYAKAWVAYQAAIILGDKLGATLAWLRMERARQEARLTQVQR